MAATQPATPPPEPSSSSQQLQPPTPQTPAYEHRPRTNNLAELAGAGGPTTLELSPLRAHYLKKTLIQLQFTRELEALTNVPDNAHNTLSYLGPPFSPPPKGSQPLSFPFLRFIFNQFVLTFPFLAAAPKDFFPSKLQPFLASLMSQSLTAADTFDDAAPDGDPEQDSRKKLLSKIEKNLSLLMVSAAKLVEGEEVVRLSQRDLDRLEMLAKKRQARRQRVAGIFDVNIVCVRTVAERGRIRSKVHEEFIIRTRRTGYKDTFVSRRYGDFRTLSDELRKAHPDEEVRPPPAKDKTTVAAPMSPMSAGPSGGFWTPPPRPSIDSGTFSPPPLNRSDTALSSTSTSSITASRLAREKNRLTLRSYLHTLLASPTLASSPVLKSFLLSSPTRLTRDEEEDSRQREEADRLREEGRQRFAHEVAARVDGLRDTINSVKHDLLEKDGLQRVFATIKQTQDANKLPNEYKAVLEWGRITLASTIFQTFIASDSGSETLSNLKRIHGLIPYYVLKGVLKISNPVGMIRGVLDLFLAQPFGGRSLLQRMFTGSLSEDVKALQEDIAAVMDKVEDEALGEKIRQYVYAPKDIKAVYRADAVAEKQHLWTVVLRSAEQPVLNRAQMNRVARASRAHAAYLRHRAELADSDDDDGPQDEDAWLYEDLTVLAKLYARLREKEDMIALIFEGSTSELLKDVITIFYAPLATVYKAANIADSLGDLQTFINDLIRTVEQVDTPGTVDPQRTVQIFIDLVQRHEQSFYSFVHKVHSKGESLFDNFMRWISLFLTFIRDGLGEPISLEFILPHTGDERMQILKEVDAVAVYHYKLKLAYEDKVRRRFARNSTRQYEDEAATQALVDSFVVDLSLGDIVAEAPELEDSDDEDETDSSEYDSDEYTTGSTDDSSDDPPPRSARPPLQSAASGSAPRSRSQSRGPRSHTPNSASLDLPQPPKKTGRARSMSLLSRSRSNSVNNKGQPPVPPVPPLPPLPPGAATSKLNPPRSAPPTKINTDVPPAHQSSARSAGPAPPRRKSVNNLKQAAQSHASASKPKQAQPTLAQPELHAIPSLLPLFVEIMRPHLTPRKA